LNTAKNANGVISKVRSEESQKAQIKITTGTSIITQPALLLIDLPHFFLINCPYPAGTKNKVRNTINAKSSIVIKNPL
jgi:hypothetical protein